MDIYIPVEGKKAMEVGKGVTSHIFSFVYFRIMIALCIQDFPSKETAVNIDRLTMYVAVYTGDQLEAT
jgi:hypothetical protein